MIYTSDRNGKITRNDSLQDRFLSGLYGNRAGRFLLRPLVSPAVSQVMGKFLDSGISAAIVPWFIKSTGIHMEDYEKVSYSSYNDFFTRKIRQGARTLDEDTDSFISPCDSRLSVYPVDMHSGVKIKHTPYTVESLLHNKKLARRYQGGYLWLYRLCVDDYHRYIYIDDGLESRHVRIPGVFHTVNPVANDVYPIYKENTREYSLLRSRHFGTVLMMEVGALMVGKIENRSESAPVRRGQEKGNFAFGGSTIVLMTERNKVVPDSDILENSRKGIETRVHLGEKTGYKVL